MKFIILFLSIYAQYQCRSAKYSQINFDWSDTDWIFSFCPQSDILNNCKYCQGDFVFHKQVTMSDMSLMFIILLLQMQTSVPPVSVEAQTPRFVPVKINDQMCYPLFKCIHLTSSSREQLKKDLARYRSTKQILKQLCS